MSEHMDAEVAILGAGPYGLSIAAFLRDAGVEVRVFGRPMASWLENMPAAMLLRSRLRSSHIAAPRRAHSLEDWAEEVGTSLQEPLPLEDFIAYGRWYQQRAVPDVEDRRAKEIAQGSGGFSVTFEDGDVLSTARVVVAAGIVPFAYTPPLFAGLPAELASHPAAHSDLGIFTGKEVMVLGGGQSALESAALLKEAGSSPTVVVRAQGLNWLPPTVPAGFGPMLAHELMPPTDVGGRVTGWVAAAPGYCRRLPDASRDWLISRCTPPIGAHWLRSRLEEVPIQLGSEVTAADPHEGRLSVTLDDDRRLDFDHALLCTGYKIDIRHYDFLAPSVLDRLEIRNGFPRLGPGLESSLPGLHFVGAPAAGSFGPIMRFVVGTCYAAPATAGWISGLRLRPRHLAYRPRVGRRAGAVPR